MVLSTVNEYTLVLHRLACLQFVLEIFPLSFEPGSYLKRHDRAEVGAFEITLTYIFFPHAENVKSVMDDKTL